MSNANGYDFDREKQLAAQRLRELGARSKYRQAGNPPPDTYRNKNNKNGEPRHSPAHDAASDLLPKFKVPFLSDLGADSDMTLILGLILILSSEKSDKLLLLALLYILI